MPRWTVVPIPGDSTRPVTLTFLDSLHGYLGVIKSYPDTTFIQLHRDSVQESTFYFETSDGGKSWKKLNDTLVNGPNDPYRNSSGWVEYNSPVVFQRLSERYILNANDNTLYFPEIAHSTDDGLSWNIPYQRTPNDQLRNFYPLRSFSPNSLFVFDVDSGTLANSHDGGKTFPETFTDSVYLYTLYHIQKDSNYFGYDKYSNYWGTSLSFDNSDNSHWTIALNRGGGTIMHPPTNPMGLQTLLTDDNGYTWKSFLTPIPGEDSGARIGGTLQFIKGTPNLYCFTGAGAEGAEIAGLLGTFVDDDAEFGINWLYSTNYGASWEFHREYGDRRRAFEAVRNNEVWITARPLNSIHTYDAASIIARTTNNGKTWDEDSTTLRLLYDDLYDGRIITFSDPRHGWIAAITGKPLIDSLRFYPATTNYHTFIFRYDANEQPQNRIELSEFEATQKIFLKIYPNPSDNLVQLQVLPWETIQQVEIFDIMGRKHFQAYHLNENIATADIHDLVTGTYFARVTYLYGGIGSFMLPFLVQH